MPCELSSSVSSIPNRQLSLLSFPPLDPPIQKDLVPSPLRAVNSIARFPVFHATATESTTSDRCASLGCHIATASSTTSTGYRHATTERKDWPFYRCTLCLHFLDPREKPSIIPGEPGRIFCSSCYTWIYKVSLCWKCRELVGRGDERVGFGWCWWHWECMGCICCAVQQISS